MKTTLSFALISAVLFVSSCTKTASEDAASSSVPANGWIIGTTNYTTTFSIRAGQPNSIAFFDALPSANNLNSTAILFNNTTGIAAGTFKVVTKPNQSNLLADEIMVAPSTGYSQSTGQYNKVYATALTETVNATVTITGGKAKIVVPQINVVSVPINTSSTTASFAGTFVEQ